MSEVDLPDTAKRVPKTRAAQTLHGAFLTRCYNAEQLIRVLAAHESGMNIDAFDSGAGIEDIIRREFSRLLPQRYLVTKGVVSDRQGHTVGDCDMIVFNDHWFPVVKSPATEESRRVHLPIDGVYALGEFKTTLTRKSRDEGMEKLVIASRLDRPSTNAYRVTENREGASCTHGATNPLYTFVLATQLEHGLSFEEAVERFFRINQTLRRAEVVRGLCVLGSGTVVWGFRHPDAPADLRPALFMLDDLYKPVVPIMFHVSQHRSALYCQVENLLMHLFHSILMPEDLAAIFGGGGAGACQGPSSAEICLPPDPDRASSLAHVCDGKARRA